MKIKILFVILFLTVSIAAQQPDRPAIQYIDSLMNNSYKSNAPGAVVLVAVNGKPIFRKAYGMANMELSVPNKPEDIFAVGSMSKQFTAVCILKLAQEGKLSLGDDIKKYLPDYNTHGRTITVENLLTHTSGITSYTEKKDFMKKLMTDYSKNEMEKFFMDDSLLFEPGSNWSYSNSNYFLAALIVEKISGIPFEKYLKENVLEPAGMKHTYFLTHDSVITGLVNGYDKLGDDKYRDAIYLSYNWTFGAGELASCADDLLKWDEALYTNKIVDQKWLRKAWTSFVLPDGNKTNYGFGWAIGNYKNTEIIRHGGAINGFLSDAIRIPSKHVFSVVLSNYTGVAPGKINEKIALEAAGIPLEEPAAVAVPEDELKKYSGVFELNREGGRITKNMSEDKFYRYITVKNDTLYSQNTGSQELKLTYCGKDLFAFGNTDSFLKFKKNAQGKIISLAAYSVPTNYGPYDIEEKTDLPLPGEKKEIKLTTIQLEKYTGTYDFGGGFSLKIFLKEDKIFGQATGQGPVELYPESETRFFLKVVDASIDFEFNGSGKITGLILHQEGDYKAKKTE